MTRFLFMRSAIAIVLVSVGALGALTVSSAMSSQASAPPVVYYACVRGGLISHVQSAPVACAAGSSAINWNQRGIAGTNGLSPAVSAEPAGAHCASGGVAVTSGATKLYVCNGVAGPKGDTGQVGPAGASFNTCTTPPGPNLNFSTCDLTSVSWYWVDVHGSSFNAATLHLAALNHSNMNGAIFRGTQMPVSQLSYATAINAIFYAANLSGATMVQSDFTGADFSLSDLTNASLNGSTLAGARLHNSDLAGATLVNSELTGDVMTGAILNSADASNANLTSTDLTGASATGANFTGANLTSANLTNASLSSAVFKGATLTSVIWSNTTCPDGTNSGTGAGATCVGHGV